MANQPPARPWFRLPNLARQPPPPPQAQPRPPSPPQQPRVPVIRTTFRPVFSQAQSAPPPPPPPQPSATQTQPPIVASSSPTPTPTPTQPSSPTTPPPPFAITSPSPPPPRPSPRPVVASPTYISPPPSPTPIKTTHSPPPISLPHTQLNSSKVEPEPRSMPEAEQEKVLLQETFNKKVVFPSSEGNSFKGHNKSSKYGRLKEADGRKSSSDSEDGKNVRIITMKGENKGALMELGFPSSNQGGNADWSKVKDHKGMAMSSRLPMSGYVNNNVQSINNSILYSCSFDHHDPGVHFSLSRKPINGEIEGNVHGIHL